jgi:murein DD-endopeptidase MepM/ murein hydrolase activator NlpD
LIGSPGSRVRAVGDGRIVATRAGLGGIVRKLELDAPAPFAPGLMPIDAVVYADLGTPLVHPGDRVRRGDSIALVGNRGFVHFAVKRGERFIDPRLAGFAYTTSPQEVA